MLSDPFRQKNTDGLVELLLIGVMRALINAIDAKDAYTWGHSDRVALMAKRLGGSILLTEVSADLRALLELAGLGLEMER